MTFSFSLSLPLLHFNAHRKAFFLKSLIIQSPNPTRFFAVKGSITLFASRGGLRVSAKRAFVTHFALSESAYALADAGSFALLPRAPRVLRTRCFAPVVSSTPVFSARYPPLQPASPSPQFPPHLTQSPASAHPASPPPQNNPHTPSPNI